MSEIQTNRLKSVSLIRGIVDAHWDKLRQARKDGGLIAWQAGLPTLLTNAYDIPTHMMGGYGAYCAGIGGGEFLLNTAESDGYNPETCSYHRMHFGNIAAIEKGIPFPIENIELPMPDIMLSARICTEHSHYTDGIYRHCGCPTIFIDIPMPYVEEDIERAIDFVERQVKEEAIPTLEKVTGRPFNYDRMSELLALTKEAGMLKSACLNLAKKIPSPCTTLDFLVTHGLVIYAITPAVVDFFRAFKEELEQRVRNKIGALSEERYRLFFDGIWTWNKMGLLSKMFNDLGANPIIGRYAHEMWPCPEAIEPENPIRTWAEQVVRYWGQIVTFGRAASAGRQFVLNAVEEHSIDGLVMHGTRTCRIYNIGQQDIIDEVKKKFGIPGVYIESDHCDSKFFAEEQIRTRLQALTEMIDGGRR